MEQPTEVAKQERIFGRDQLGPAQRRSVKHREMLSRNKRSLLLDLRDERGRTAALRMAEQTDVLIHDYRPGTMEQMGLGYEQLRVHNPRLVYCAVSLCGQTGPYRDAPGHDPVALALAGALTRFGDNGEAAIPGLPVGDLSTGLQAVIGVMMALRVRDRNGQGQLVDVAMSDCALGLMTSVMQRYLMDGREPPLHWQGGNVGLWRTADGGSLCTTDLEPAFWERFCRAVGREDLIPLQFDDARRDWLVRELEQLFAGRSRAEWVALLRTAGTQVAPVYSLDEALQDEHARARGTVLEIRTDEGETVVQIGPAVKLSATPGAIRTLAEPAGSHGADILRDYGFCDTEIHALAADGR